LTKPADSNSLFFTINRVCSRYEPERFRQKHPHGMTHFSPTSPYRSSSSHPPVFFQMKYSVLVLAVLLAVGFTPDCCPAEAEAVVVNVLVARVRQAPSTKAPILFHIRRGESALITRTQEDWYRIELSDGQTGWAHNSLFTKTRIDSKTSTTPKPVIQSVRHRVLDDSRAEVSFQLSGFHPPKIFVLSGDKPRVVCDFLDMLASPGLGPRIETAQSVIKNVRISPYGGIVPRVRIVLDLIAGPSYTVDHTFFKKENLYVVSIQSRSP